MADQVTETTSSSFGQNIVSSVKGVVIGLILFIASFVILWISEGQTNWGKVAKTSREITGDRVNAAAEGAFVSISGKLVSPDEVGDPGYLKPGPYLSLSRQVEMYAWTEKSSSKTKKKIGGGSETTTTYSYEREWTGSPDDSSGFKQPEGHFNPSLSVEDREFRVGQASVGAYPVAIGRLGLPGGSRVELNEEILGFSVPVPAPTAPGPAPEQPAGAEAAQATTPVPVPAAPAPDQPRLAGGYIYLGAGSPQAPRIGDIRISYLALPAGTEVTVFGVQKEGKLAPYSYEDSTFYRALAGGRAEAISQLGTEYKVKVWIMRAIGFLAMWFGMMLMVGPISTLLDVLPFLGNLSRGIFNLVLFPVALVLSLLTILISKVAHNPIALIVVLLVIVGGGAFWFRKARAAKAAAAEAGS